MEIAKTKKTVKALVKAARNKGKTIGFVPTMGALHAGHISLINAATEKCDFVIVSIFVNPTQFAPNEDLDKYPKPLEKDLEICKHANADLVFTPPAEQIYPSENITWVTVEKLTDHLCGRSRPNHFRGVTTVCAKLFNIVDPDFAFFGQKDAQQAIVIKKMVADLNMTLDIVICPTIRQTDGLAISSRNQYLTEKQKKDATAIYKSLLKCKQMVKAGEYDCKTIINQMRTILDDPASLKVEYVSIANAETLRDIDKIDKKVLVAIAAKVGLTRLIDNIMVDCSEK